ncbi:MAG: hypothetical protein E7282_02260 [Lachnospiraceae bacterium]|nr:hypothetical protein [Lachnospiraceae bacterium]
MNGGMKRVFKYMTNYSQRILLYTLAFIVAMVFYLTLVSNGFSLSGLEEQINYLPALFIALGALMQMVYTFAYIPILSNMELSMGATRKEVACGMVYAFCLESIELCIIAILLRFAIKDSFFLNEGEYAMAIIGVMFGTAGLGILIALLIEKFGKIAYYIAVAIVALLGGLVGGVSVALMDSFFIGKTFDITHICQIICIVGLVIYVISAAVYYAANRKRVVRV